MNKKFISFSFGEYEGEYLKHGKPHGKGIFKYFDGGMYKGGWKNGKYHGKGKIIFTTNDVMAFGGIKKWTKSSFRKNQLKKYNKFWRKMHGYGLALKQENFHINDGSTGELSGVWNQNKINYGIKTYYDAGSMYKGEFKNNIQNGKGRHVYKNIAEKKYSKFPNQEYSGEFKNGVWHGQGKFIDIMEDRYYLGEDFEKKRVKGDRIVAEWFGKWKNGYENGKYIINIYYFNSKQKLVFKKVVDALFKIKGKYDANKSLLSWNIRDKQ